MKRKETKNTRVISTLPQPEAGTNNYTLEQKFRANMNYTAYALVRLVQRGAPSSSPKETARTL